MRILFYSPAFYPNVGGVEAVVAMVAEGLTALGCSVKVVTTTPGTGDDASFPYDIVRFPSAASMLSLLRWSDVFFHHNVSLKGIWPLLIVRRPWVVAHHGWYTRSNGSLGWQDWLKRFAARFATNIAVSQSVADNLPVQCTVIPNPYRDDLFCKLPEVNRDRELVFLGRLVSQKGCDLLLDALALLRSEGLKPRLTVIGNGPEESRLKERAQRLGLDNQVEFVGMKGGEELVRLLNKHTIMIVPSRWNEPFGIVALEGIACGCVILASSGGGLSDAVGPCGITFPGDLQALVNQIKVLLHNPHILSHFLSYAEDHLGKHAPLRIAGEYLDVLKKRVEHKRK